MTLAAAKTEIIIETPLIWWTLHFITQHLAITSKAHMGIINNEDHEPPLHVFPPKTLEINHLDMVFN